MRASWLIVEFASPPMKPNIFFHSAIDSAEGWRAALATQFDEFLFSTFESLEHPEAVDIALIWTVPDGGCTISRNGPARFRSNGPTLHGLPAEPRFESFTRPFSLRQVF